MSRGKRGAIQSRSKYIHHSLRFLDWVRDIGSEETWFGRALNWIERSIPVRRLLLISFFSALVAVVAALDFSPLEPIRTGEVMHRDIYSPASFELVDQDATERKRAEAEAAVRPVFDYDLKAYTEAESRVSSSFRAMRESLLSAGALGPRMSRERLFRLMLEKKSAFEEAAGTQVSDLVFEWLSSQKFSTAIEDALLESFALWRKYYIVPNLEEDLPAGAREIALREKRAEGADYREMVIPTRMIRDGANIEDVGIASVISSHRFSLVDARRFADLATLFLKPTLISNAQETARRRVQARESVSSVFVRVREGQLLIAKGVSAGARDALVVQRAIELQHQERNPLRLAFAIVALTILLAAMVSSLRRVPSLRVEQKETFVMAVVLILTVAIVRVVDIALSDAGLSFAGKEVPSQILLFLAPVAAGPMLIGLLLLPSQVSWFFAIYLSVAVGLAADFMFSFTLVSLVGGLMAARWVHGCERRSDLYLAGLKTGLVNTVVAICAVGLERQTDPQFWDMLMMAGATSFIGGLFSGLVALMTIPLAENLFNVTTDVKLLELSNLSHPLLKEMIVRAPGTYHHSLVVGSMVEAAAERIGANPLLAKVMAYFHDIGKMDHANYFIENQKPGQNPHDHLSPHMSKTILVAHVKDGVELGLRHKLGKPIIDGIVQHHGTTLISFFYNRAVESQDADIDEVREEEFRYPGPKPQFQEAALIMLADSIEAAARSLDEPTPSRLQNIVKAVIQRKFMDGQLDECDLTLRDLTVIEETFIHVLHGIYHQRIDYPREVLHPLEMRVEKVVHRRSGEA